MNKELITIIESDDWMITILRTVRSLNLKDGWVGAGFVRNKIWDVKHGKSRTELNDIDVIHFDQSNASKAYDVQLENKLKALKPGLNWSVKNQSRMHLRNGQCQYKNCNEAISFWPETATCVAVKLNSSDTIESIAPYGLNDLFHLIVKPTPGFNPDVYHSRITKKKWKEQWNQLEIKM